MLAFLLAFATVWAGCAGGGKNPDGDDTEQDGGDTGGGDKEPDGDETPEYAFEWDGGLLEAERDKQTSVNALSATDDFGRSFGYMNGFKTDKYVCLFYFAWLGQEAKEMTGVYDISKLLESNAAALWNTDGTPESPLGQYHFWGEPL